MPEQKTQTWRSKKDPSKKLMVKLPFYGIAETTDGQSIHRDQLQLDYEPELQPVSSASLEGASPAALGDDRVDRLMQQIGLLTETLRGVQAKVAEMHAIVVPQPDKGATRS
jgi:hypothetical protein